MRLSAKTSKCSCGKEEQGDKKRCNDCQRDATNLCRAIKSLGVEKSERWQKALESGAVDRDEFLAKAKGKLPKDIAKAVCSYVEETTTNECSVQMVGTGVFLDEEDLDNKYKAKPKRLAAIKRNAERVWCPTGEVELFEGMTYVSTEKNLRKRTVTEGHRCEGEAKLKKAKVERPKPVKAETTATGVDPPEPKDITEPQKKKAEKWVIIYEKELSALKLTLEECDKADWKEYIPAYVLRKSQASIAKLDAHHIAVQNVIHEGRSVDFKKNEADHKDISNEIKAAKRALGVHIDEAKTALQEAQAE